MKGLIKNEKGFSLIEVLVALAIVALVAVAFLTALATASKTVIIADERTTSESLARSQMEYVKDQTYIDYSEEGHSLYLIITPPSGYSIGFTAVPFIPATGEDYLVVAEVLVDGEYIPIYDYDDGIQRMTVAVSHNGEVVLALEDYKVDR